jgi:hypothetical protein
MQQDVNWQHEYQVPSISSLFCKQAYAEERSRIGSDQFIYWFFLSVWLILIEFVRSFDLRLDQTRSDSVHIESV